MNRSALLTMLVLLAGWPAVAEAHLVTTGLGPVYDGIGHLLLTPEDIIAVLALCMFAGLRGTAHSRSVLFLLPIVWFLAGRLIGFHIDGIGSFPVAAISFILLGILVAADAPVGPAGVGLLAIALGAVHGLDNGIALREGAGLKGLLGIMAAMFVVVSLATAAVVSLRKPWMRIVVRVAGSWIVATGILMLGWHFRPQPETSVAIEPASVSAADGTTRIGGKAPGPGWSRKKASDRRLHEASAKSAQSGHT